MQTTPATDLKYKTHGSPSLNTEKAKTVAEDICLKLLSNVVIEDYLIEIK